MCEGLRAAIPGEIDGIVAHDIRRHPELADIAREVVDERVVVVDDEDHADADV